VAPRLAGNFFSLDLQATREAFETLPWVRQAVVTRWWPNRLVVHLLEQHPVALWDNEGRQDRLVNQQGEVFEANVGDVEDEPLPTLGGPEGSSAQVLQMVHRLQPVFARMDAGIDSLKLSSRGSWRATLDTGAVIEIGRGSDDEVAERADRFVRTVAQVSGKFDRPVQYADLRHPDGYALRLKGVSTTIDAPAAGAATARAPAR
jgi:cell division protein FtsQ